MKKPRKPRKPVQEGKWMDGEEAIAHIMKANNCSRALAERELMLAIVAGKVKAFVKPEGEAN